MRSSRQLVLSLIIFAPLAPFHATNALADDDCAMWVITHPNDYTTMIQCAPPPATMGPHQPILAIPHAAPRHEERTAARPIRHKRHVAHHAMTSPIDMLMSIFRPRRGR